MNKTNKRILIILSIIGLVFVVVVSLFIFMLAYESRKDVSDQTPYSFYLNRPIEIKHITTIRWSKTGHRFSQYSLNHNEDSNFNTEDLKSVKKYQPGETINFYAAKKFHSMHVGDNYYLIGRDTLDTGEAIEFEYYYQDKYFYNIWETEAEFLERIKNKIN